MADWMECIEFDKALIVNNNLVALGMQKALDSITSEFNSSDDTDIIIILGHEPKLFEAVSPDLDFYFLVYSKFNYDDNYHIMMHLEIEASNKINIGILSYEYNLRNYYLGPMVLKEDSFWFVNFLDRAIKGSPSKSYIFENEKALDFMKRLLNFFLEANKSVSQPLGTEEEYSKFIKVFD